MGAWMAPSTYPFPRYSVSSRLPAIRIVPALVALVVVALVVVALVVVAPAQVAGAPVPGVPGLVGSDGW
jgi:hypothetical protein